jgi:hypothetical protein
MVARTCCFNGTRWHKPPAKLGLKLLPPASKVQKCYMKELNSCVAPISGEHLISQSVIEILQGNGDFSVEGLPWQEPGKIQKFAPQSFRTNCLCTKHNSALHPLDDAAKHLFGSLKSFLESEEGFRHAIVSGYDIERWLLKTAKAFAVSRNFAKEKMRLPGTFRRDGAILDMLDSPDHWPDGAGLYCVMRAGELVRNESNFRLRPLTNNQDEIEALEIGILGLAFVLLLVPFDAARHSILRDAKFRPGRIEVAYPQSTHWLTLSWEDERQHGTLTMQHRGDA